MSDTVTNTLPAVCFEDCNNANLEAQSRGKVPSLCDPGSTFRVYLDNCTNCIDQNEGEGRQYTDNAFAQYLNYCSAISAGNFTITQTLTAIPTSAIPTSWLTYSETFEPIVASNLAISGITIPESTTLYRQTNITLTKPAYYFHTSVQSLISSYIPPAVFSELAASAASAASVASVTGDATSLVYSALEDETRPPWFSSAVPSTYTSEMVALEASINEMRAVPVSTTPLSTASDSATPSGRSSTEGSASNGSGSKAWIAGAVVGSLAGVALILLGVFLFLRRKKLAARVEEKPKDYSHDPYMTGLKPELHAEPVPLPPRIYEMDASPSLSELAAHEKPQELSQELNDYEGSKILRGQSSR